VLRRRRPSPRRLRTAQVRCGVHRATWSARHGAASGAGAGGVAAPTRADRPDGRWLRM